MRKTLRGVAAVSTGALLVMSIPDAAVLVATGLGATAGFAVVAAALARRGVAIGGPPGWSPTDVELVPVDAIAQLLVDDDLPTLRTRFAEPDVAVPPTIVSIVDGRPTPVPLDPALVTV